MKWFISAIASRLIYILIILSTVVFFGISLYGYFYKGETNLSFFVVLMMPNIAVLLIVTCARIELLYSKQSSQEVLLKREIDILRDLIKDLSQKSEQSESPKIEILNTPFDFYRALNKAREQSSKSIHLMKLHHQGPSEVGIKIGGDLDPEKNDDRSYMERHLWYNGLREWNQAGRVVVRITVRTSKSMEKFIKEMCSFMKGTDFITYELAWDGKMPLMNLCIFDMKQVLITFSTPKGESAYLPITGVRIYSPHLASFFYRQYYEKMERYSKRIENQ